MKKIIGISVFTIAAGAIAGYLAYHPGLVRSLAGISPAMALLLVLLNAASLVVNGIYLWTACLKFGIRLKAREWLGLASVTAMGNYVAPFSAGVVARAAYLKSRHGFPLTHYAALLSANYMIALAAIGGAGVSSMLTLTGTESFSGPLLLFFAGVLGSVVLVRYLPFPQLGLLRSGLKRLRSGLEGVQMIREDGRLLLTLLILTGLNIGIGTLLYHTAFTAIGKDVPIRIALLVYVLTASTVLVNITPGNLGIQEIVASLGATVLGVGGDAGLMASLLVRAASVLTAFVLGPPFSVVLSRELLKKARAFPAGGEPAPGESGPTC